ncbi:hypothetical protein [Bacillus sp. FJAT-49736]|nr:hypothetical protein [Bacillus sp. FJAT-49736]
MNMQKLQSTASIKIFRTYESFLKRKKHQKVEKQMENKTIAK